MSENRFARADLAHIRLLIDNDMRMEALRQTSFVKSLVTARCRMDLEKKGRQRHPGWMFARLPAFSNGDLQSLCEPQQRLLAAQEPKLPKIHDRQPEEAQHRARQPLTNLPGRRVWGLTGIAPVLKRPPRTADGWQRDCSDDSPFS
ncbi:MAG: hypothetical protein ACI4O7_04035 [Aristaeellaceae bacterium]